jgi:hypothetical protein
LSFYGNIKEGWSMGMETVITIGRQYGSGGREIGEKLAGALNIKFYDKDLLKRAAKESGICPELFENNDEKPTSSFLYNLVSDPYSFGVSSPYVEIKSAINSSCSIERSTLYENIAACVI